MLEKSGAPHTAHTTNLVHFLYIAQDANEHALEDGILADVAPTLLDMLKIPKPPAMKKGLAFRAVFTISFYLF
jgi:2,3-bisphosphoglycerate-independent phosphoglycerate mutase